MARDTKYDTTAVLNTTVGPAATVIVVKPVKVKTTSYGGFSWAVRANGPADPSNESVTSTTLQVEEQTVRCVPAKSCRRTP